MILHDLRHAFRRLVREPGFTAAAVLTLALGVGANVAVFAVVEAVLLRPLPYPDADRIVSVRHRDEKTGITKEFIAIGDYVDLGKRQSSLQTMAGYGTFRATIFGDGEPYQVPALTATAAALDILGLRPIAGRSLTASDEVTGAGSVAILGNELWRTRFGSDPAVVGRSIRVGNSDRIVVGIAPPGFRFPPSANTGLILNQIMPAQAPASRKAGWTFALGRLANGRTVVEANADLATVSRQLAAEFPTENQGSMYYGQSLRDATAGSTKTPLILLLAAVAVVLLIACANVANLLLARALGRRRELAVRMTLGAGRHRIIRQLLTESLALALVSGAAGVLIATLGVKALVGMIPEAVAPPGLDAIGINGPVLLFALGIVVVTTFACGLVAALSLPVDNAAQLVVASGKSTMTVGARRATSALVVGEIALAVVLLIGAGLILRSFASLLAVDPGFRPDGVLAMDVAVAGERYQQPDAAEGFWNRSFESIGAVPGVEAVGVAVVTPLTGNNWTSGFRRADQELRPDERPPEVGWQAASGGYFAALRIPLKSGRLFDRTDRPNTPTVVIVSEALERRFFPGDSAVGHQVRVGNGTAEIVGVVGDIRRAGLREEPRPDIYFPFEQGPGAQMTLFVRGGADAARLETAIRSAIRSIEPNAVIGTPRLLADIARDSVQDTRLVLWLLGVFAVVAVSLAAVGIYGVMGYVVRQRTREIGTRLALGAGRFQILGMVMRQGATIAGLGAAIGVALAIVATRALQSMLFGVSSFDPAVLAAAVAVLFGTALIACYLPARRAANVDPAKTLQEP